MNYDFLGNGTGAFIATKSNGVVLNVLPNTRAGFAKILKYGQLSVTGASSNYVNSANKIYYSPTTSTPVLSNDGEGGISYNIISSLPSDAVEITNDMSQCCKLSSNGTTTVNGVSGTTSYAFERKGPVTNVIFGTDGTEYSKIILENISNADDFFDGDIITILSDTNTNAIDISPNGNLSISTTMSLKTSSASNGRMITLVKGDFNGKDFAEMSRTSPTAEEILPSGIPSQANQLYYLTKDYTGNVEFTENLVNGQVFAHGSFDVQNLQAGKSEVLFTIPANSIVRFKDIMYMGIENYTDSNTANINISIGPSPIFNGNVDGSMVDIIANTLVYDDDDSTSILYTTTDLNVSVLLNSGSSSAGKTRVFVPYLKL